MFNLVCFLSHMRVILCYFHGLLHLVWIKYYTIGIIQICKKNCASGNVEIDVKIAPDKLQIVAEKLFKMSKCSAMSEYSASNWNEMRNMNNRPI